MQKLKVYIVEDNPLLASALKHNLLCCGYTICGMAATYEKAVRDFETITPDLIVTDIMLATPKTGIDLAVYINQHLQIPFIFQSSITEKPMIVAALKQKPVSFLTKPVKREQLARALESFLEPASATCNN